MTFVGPAASTRVWTMVLIVSEGIMSSISVQHGKLVGKPRSDDTTAQTGKLLLPLASGFVEKSCDRTLMAIVRLRRVSQAPIHFSEPGGANRRNDFVWTKLR